MVSESRSKVNRHNIYIHLLEKQFNLLDKTVEEALISNNEWRKWTISQEQYESFKKYAVPLLKKVFKINRTKAEGIFNWFRLQHGLSIKCGNSNDSLEG